MRFAFDTLKSDDNFFICYQIGYDDGDYFYALGFSTYQDFVKRIKDYWNINKEEIKLYTSEKDILDFLSKHKNVFYNFEDDIKPFKDLFVLYGKVVK